MGKLGVCGHICLVFSGMGVVFLGFMTLLAVFDPERLHIVGPHEEAHGVKVVRAWTSSGIATFVPSIP
jgi:hypothetical protein